METPFSNNINNLFSGDFRLIKRGCQVKSLMRTDFSFYYVQTLSNLV